VKTAGNVLAIILALVAQTTLARFLVRGSLAVDLVLVAVIYIALTSGPGAGLWSGTVAGLIQDALSGGIIGVGGLAKTIVGFLTGIIGTQFIVAQPFPRFVVFLAATLLHATIFVGLYAILEVRQFGNPYGVAAIGQAVGNAVVGVVAFQVVGVLPGAVERRRARSQRIRR
jgi:rod shape-determining protein MreD